MGYACSLLEDNVYLLWGSFVCVVTLASSSVIFIFSEKRKKNFYWPILMDPNLIFACWVFIMPLLLSAAFLPKLTFSKRNTIIRKSNGLDPDQDQWWSVQISGANPGFDSGKGVQMCRGRGVHFAEFISTFSYIPWKWKNLVSLRPNYFIFHGILKGGGGGVKRTPSGSTTGFGHLGTICCEF